MTSYIVIEDASGIIVNRIVLDNPAVWDAPEDHSIVNDTASPMAIGGTYIGGIYTPPVPPVVPPLQLAIDPNARIDAGILAAVSTVISARDAVHAIPHSGAVPARFDQLLIQMAVMADAFVAMLQAQAAPPPGP